MFGANFSVTSIFSINCFCDLYRSYFYKKYGFYTEYWYILQVTDEGIGHIAKNCEKLKKINLHSCSVSCCVTCLWFSSVTITLNSLKLQEFEEMLRNIESTSDSTKLCACFLRNHAVVHGLATKEKISWAQMLYMLLCGAFDTKEWGWGYIVSF